MIAIPPNGSQDPGIFFSTRLFWVLSDLNKGASMTHPTPPLSGENLLLDDEDVILLTDEIPPAENHDMIEIRPLDDRSEPLEVSKLSETSKDKPAFIDLTAAIEPSDFKTGLPPDFSISESDILNFDLEEISPSASANEFSDSRGLPSETAPLTPSLASDAARTPAAEYQEDDLQRLIDEVVHDSQVPPQDFSGIPPEISKPVDYSVVKDDLLSLPRDQVDAAMERVIRNLFAEKIEPILDEVITATVNREIENLKTVLIDYLTSGRTFHKFKS
jgi:hypothetical protein